MYQRIVDAALDEDQRLVGIHADAESDRERIGTVGRAGRLHVDHAVDAVDPLLDDERHLIDDGLGLAPG